MKKETKIQKFERIYKKEIKEGSWITKDDMTNKGFYPKVGSNGKDLRFIEGKYELEEFWQGNKVSMFRIIGLKNEDGTRSIKKSIRDEISKRACAITGTRNRIEVDHKNGRYNNPRVLNTKTQRIDDFQALTRSLNLKKREICKKCAETNQRFDAKKLGYPISTLDGNIEHNGTPFGCYGCFYYDPEYFREQIRWATEGMEGQILKLLSERLQKSEE